MQVLIFNKSLLLTKIIKFVDVTTAGTSLCTDPPPLRKNWGMRRGEGGSVHTTAVKRLNRYFCFLLLGFHLPVREKWANAQFPHRKTARGERPITCSDQRRHWFSKCNEGALVCPIITLLSSYPVGHFLRIK